MADPGRRHGSSRWRWLAGLAVACALVALAAAAPWRGGRERAACRPPDPAGRAQLALLPEGLSFARIGTVTRVRANDRHVLLRAVTTRPIDEVTVQIQDAVAAAGYRPAGMDNEGFEAEVFFTSGRYAAGQAIVRRSRCAGRWDIDLVLLRR